MLAISKRFVTYRNSASRSSTSCCITFATASQRGRAPCRWTPYTESVGRFEQRSAQSKESGRRYQDERQPCRTGGSASAAWSGCAAEADWRQSWKGGRQAKRFGQADLSYSGGSGNRKGDGCRSRPCEYRKRDGS